MSTQGPTIVSQDESNILRVSASSNVQAVGAAIAHGCYDNRRVSLRAVGAGAVNQAVKAIAAARGFAAPRGLDLVCKPGFATVPGKDGGEISAMMFIVIAD